MNRIIAMIRPVMRDDVIAALHQVEDFPGASITEIMGVHRGTCQSIEEHKEPLRIDFPIYTRIEIICADTLTAQLVEAIRAAAHTGRSGDGKVFVSPVSFALRISNGQVAEEAL